MKMIFTLTTAVMISFWSCAEPKRSGKHELEKEISQQWQAFEDMWEAEDAEGCATIYTPDGVNIPSGGAKNEGKAAISSFYQILFDGHLSSDYEHRTVDIKVSGETAIEEGAFTVNWVSNDSTEWKYEARSLALWEKGADGKWLIDKFIFNTPDQ